MEKDKQKRPTDRGRTAVMKEQPRTPASRPKDPRPRTGNAASREAARKERLRAEEADPDSRGSGRSASRSADRQSSRREQPAGRTQTARREQPAEKTRTSRREPPAKKAQPSQRERLDRQEEAVRRVQTSRQEAPARREPPAKKRRAEPEMAGQAAPKHKKKKPHRVYNTNFGFKFVIMLSVVAVIVLSMIIFFKVKHIEVLLPTDENGQTRAYYTADELVDASGINLDDNLLSLSKAAVAARIYAALPYINEVQIKKQLPGTVVITFSEFDVTYGIQDEKGGWWLMSREGRILEAAGEDTVRGHLTVTGMPIQQPEVGDRFKPAATEGADMSEIANKQTVVLQVIPALEKTSFVKDVDRVDVSTSYDLTLWWTGGRYEVKLGTTERLDYKLQCLQSILEDDTIRKRSGTIDLTFNEDSNAHFLPFS